MLCLVLCAFSALFVFRFSCHLPRSKGRSERQSAQRLGLKIYASFQLKTETLYCEARSPLRVWHHRYRSGWAVFLGFVGMWLFGIVPHKLVDDLMILKLILFVNAKCPTIGVFC